MTGRERIELLRQGVAASLAVAARRGPEALEQAVARLTPMQRGAVPRELLDELRHAANHPAGYRVGDIHPTNHEDCHHDETPT